MYFALCFPDWENLVNPLIANFNYYDFFANNEYNPIAWVAEVFSNQLAEWDPSYVRESESAPDDAWLMIFGESYEVYYRRYIWTYYPFYQFGIVAG